MMDKEMHELYQIFRVVKRKYNNIKVYVPVNIETLTIVC